MSGVGWDEFGVPRERPRCRAVVAAKPARLAGRAPSRLEHGSSLGDSFRNPPALVGPA